VEARVVRAEGAPADQDGVGAGAFAVGMSPRRLAGDPFAAAVEPGDEAVRGQRQLQSDFRDTGGLCAAVTGEALSAWRVVGAKRFDAGGADTREALPGRARVGIFHAGDNSHEPSLHSQISAGRAALAAMGARLQGDIEGRTARSL